jgi:hypothetical protein
MCAGWFPLDRSMTRVTLFVARRSSRRALWRSPRPVGRRERREAERRGVAESAMRSRGTSLRGHHDGDTSTSDPVAPPRASVCVRRRPVRRPSRRHHRDGRRRSRPDGRSAPGSAPPPEARPGSSCGLPTGRGPRAPHRPASNHGRCGPARHASRAPPASQAIEQARPLTRTDPNLKAAAIKAMRRTARRPLRRNRQPNSPGALRLQNVFPQEPVTPFSI